MGARAIVVLCRDEEALHRFVEREPLYRVHECVFGVLAPESEPVDPRLLRRNSRRSGEPCGGAQVAKRTEPDRRRQGLEGRARASRDLRSKRSVRMTWTMNTRCLSWR